LKPILLNLNTVFREAADEPTVVSLDTFEREAERLMADLRDIIGVTRSRTICIPSELLLQAVDTLMPAERMGVLGGRQVGDRFILSTLSDVTGRGHIAHVTADPRKLANALLMMERAGARLAAWIHSHPGRGPSATMPSAIDRDQYADWVRHYSETLVGIIVVRDGFIRFWGDAVESGRSRVEVLGGDVRGAGEGRNVFRLA
jgi:proteasome lid subunit RPN8/RPN11